MKTILLIAFIVTTLSAAGSNLTVIVAGIQIGKGNIIIDLYNSKETFLSKSLVSRTVKPDSSQMEIPFAVAEGEYSIAVFQDKNNNGILDKGLFNIPQEPYGFSTNFRPTWSKPGFDDCKIEVTHQTVAKIFLK